MKTLLSTLAVTAAVAIPGGVDAKPVTLTVNMNAYGGPGAYLALYVTDANGAYQGSLWMAGRKSKYHRHLGSWYRATRGDPGQVRGITGASVGSGRQLKINLDLSDALFDAGYKLHIDAAVENWRDSPEDVVVPLTSGNAGKSVAGRRYIRSFTFN